MSCSTLRLWAVELSKIGFRAVYRLRSTHREALWWSVLVGSTWWYWEICDFVPCMYACTGYTVHVLSRAYHGTRGAVVMSSP